MITDLKLAKRLLQTYDSAASRDIQCSLSLKKLKQLMEQKVCYYTGQAFDPKNSGMTMSIDRVDAKLGYHDNNVVACVAHYNGKKNNLTIAEIVNLYNKVIQFKKKQDANLKKVAKVVRKKKV